MALQERGTLKLLKIRWWKKLRGGEHFFWGWVKVEVNVKVKVAERMLGVKVEDTERR